jgi:RimJ/RimL family protein N-acetyltransferase
MRDSWPCVRCHAFQRIAAVVASTHRLASDLAGRSAWFAIAYDLSPVVRGRGFASDACALVADWGHDHAGLVRIQATVLESNKRCIKVLERCGFQREGLVQSYRFVRRRSAKASSCIHTFAALRMAHSRSSS